MTWNLNAELNLVWYLVHHLNTGPLNIGQVKVHYLDVSVIQMIATQMVIMCVVDKWCGIQMII